MLVNLSKDEMSTILYVLEGYVQGNDDEELVAEIDGIFEKFEGIRDACECKEQEKQRDTYNKINSQKNDKEIRTGIIKSSISKS